MDKKYFLIINNKQHGPYPIAELKSRGLTLETLVWTDGLAMWQAAKEIAELKSLFSSPPPLNLVDEQPVKKKNFLLYGLAAIGGLVLIVLTIAGISDSGIHRQEIRQRNNAEIARVAQLERERIADSIATVNDIIKTETSITEHKALLEVHREKMNSIKEFHFLRLESEKNQQIKQQSYLIQDLENSISKLNKQKNQLEQHLSLLSTPHVIEH